MNFLAVDVGNTSTAVGLWCDGRIASVFHCDGGLAKAVDIAERVIASAGFRVDAVAYASVVPKVDSRWRTWASKRGMGFHAVSFRDFGCSCVSDEKRTLPKICYPHPETIGADRLADAAGAMHRYGAPVLVMDFGTALTAAVITGDRVWRGGVIAPGFPLMSDYLFERTAKLPRLKLGLGRVPKIGRSTEQAMRFGVLVGYRGMVREIVTQLKANFNEDFRLVATGGFARWAIRDMDMGFVVDPTLTVFGTGLLAAKSLGGDKC